MPERMRLRRTLIATLAALALVAAACGSGDDADDPAGPNAGSEAPAPLPPNPSPDDTPPAAGACLEGEPDCNDTLGPGEVPDDLPPPSDEPVSPGGSQGALVAGGLTVSEALASDAVGTIAVKGFLFIDERGARLCESLAESFPPQCGGASIPVTDYEEVLDVPVMNESGVGWTDQTVSFLGEIDAGTLVVDPFVAQ